MLLVEKLELCFLDCIVFVSCCFGNFSITSFFRCLHGGIEEIPYLCHVKGFHLNYGLHIAY